MNAMIFAAGLGSRLSPLTDNCPKALLPVAGVSMIEHAILKLRDEIGVDRVVVNVHSHADMMERWLRDNARRLGVEILLSDERGTLLDTGGGLLKAESLLSGDRMILYNADIMTDIDLGQMIDAHDRSGADVTLLVADRVTSRKLLFDGDDLMRGWTNISTGEVRPAFMTCEVDKTTALAFGGIHIVSQAIFPLLHDYSVRHGDVFSITPFYLWACDRLRISAWRQPSGTRWVDAGKPESYAVANRLWSVDKWHDM